MNVFLRLIDNYECVRVPHWVQNQMVFEFDGGDLTVASLLDDRVSFALGNASAMQIIKAIQSSKKNINLFESVSFEQQLTWLSSIKSVLEKHQKEIAFVESHFQGTSVDAQLAGAIQPLLLKIEEALGLLKSGKMEEVLAKTTIAGIAPVKYSFFELGWRILFSLFHKTPVILKPSTKGAISSLLWIEILQDLALPESLIQFVQGEGKVVGDFLIAHPGVGHISFSGKFSCVSTIFKSFPFLEKKYQFYSGGKNSLVLLPGYDFKTHKSQIIQLIKDSLNQGMLSFEKIFLTETIEKDFKEEIVLALQELPIESFPVLSEQQKKQLQELKKNLVAEGARLLFENENFVLLSDLSNCSEWHQESQDFPLMNITTVKYQHEIYKWINNTPFGHSVFILGETEKAQRFSKKVEVRNIFINPVKINNGFFYGYKNSGFGELDFSLPNSFFSYAKNFPHSVEGLE